MTNILLMEPDRLLARTYRQALQTAGHTVSCQTDAQKSLDVIDDQNIGLIILELQLAPHNGVELLYELRSYPDWDHIPVLLHTMVPTEHPGLGRVFWDQLNIAGYLYKPQTSLAQLIRQVSQTTVTAA